MDIAIIAFERFTDVDVFLPWDLLNRVAEDDWNVRILGKSDHVTSSVGLTIPTHGSLSEANRADAVVFASGKGIDTAIAEAGFISAFDLDDGRQLIGSMCAGAPILGELGLLDGPWATTYPTRMATTSARHRGRRGRLRAPGQRSHGGGLPSGPGSRCLDHQNSCQSRVCRRRHSFHQTGWRGLCDVSGLVIRHFFGRG